MTQINLDLMSCPSTNYQTQHIHFHVNHPTQISFRCQNLHPFSAHLPFFLLLFCWINLENNINLQCMAEKLLFKSCILTWSYWDLVQTLQYDELTLLSWASTILLLVVIPNNHPQMKRLHWAFRCSCTI